MEVPAWTGHVRPASACPGKDSRRATRHDKRALYSQLARSEQKLARM